MKMKLEYVWLDGYEPVPNLRSKTQIEGVRRPARRSTSSRCGASTAARRARPKAASSDCMLQPVAVFPDPARRERRCS